MILILAALEIVAQLKHNGWLCVNVNVRIKWWPCKLFDKSCSLNTIQLHEIFECL